MSIPYLEKSSSDSSLPMNQPAKKPQPAAWRSREIGKPEWRVHTEDPTENLNRYAVGIYEVEPLYSRS